MRKCMALLLGLMMIVGLPLSIFAQGEVAPSPQVKSDQDVVDRVLHALSRLPQELGELVTRSLHKFFPDLVIPSSIDGAAGLLGVVTLLLVMARFLKRSLWMVIGAGWFLIILRIVKVILQG